jgi:hypothetical protein
LSAPSIQQPTAEAIALTKGDQKSGFSLKVFLAIVAIIALIIIIGESRKTTAGSTVVQPEARASSPPTYMPPQKEIVTATAQELLDFRRDNVALLRVADDLRLIR